MKRALTTVMGILVLTVALRVPALCYRTAIDDEKVYAVVAGEMLAGALPYRDVIERKPPLLFWLYEGVFSLSGGIDFTALHVAGLLWLLATMAGLYDGARQRFGRETGLAAALLYGVFMAAAEYKNLAVNGELLMNLPVVWAWALVLRREPGRRALTVFAAGVLLACAALIKQPAGAAAVALGLYTLLPSYGQARGLSRAGQLGLAALMTLGALLTVALVAAVLAQQGILSEALYWSLGDHDVPHGPLSAIFWQRAWGGGMWFLGSCAPLTLLVVLALRDGWRGQRWFSDAMPELQGLLLLLSFSVLGAAASGRFYTHYFLQLVPAMAWLGAVVLVGVRHRPEAYRSRLLQPAVLHLGICVSALAFLVLDARALSRQQEHGATAAYVESHSSNDDRIFVWGQTTGFYLRAHRRPASRYIAVFPLTGYIFGSPLGLDPKYDTRSRIVPGAWDLLMQDLGRHPPRFIVDSDSTSAHPKYNPFDYPQLAELLRRDYVRSFTSSDGIAYSRLPSAAPTSSVPFEARAGLRPLER